MQLTPTQFSVLSQMGIPVWELRPTDVPTAAVVSTEIATGSVEVDLSACCLVVVPQSPISNDERRLLTAMLKAIGISLEDEVAIYSRDQFSQIPQAAFTNMRILSLGMNLIDEPFEGMVATYTLTELLADNRLKAHAWQALKLLRVQD